MQVRIHAIEPVARSTAGRKTVQMKVAMRLTRNEHHGKVRASGRDFPSAGCFRFCHPHSDRWPNTISTTTRRVGFSSTTCSAEIKIEATMNENKGLLYSSILGFSSVSGSFEHMSGCHIFHRPLGFGAHLIWNFGVAIMLGSHQNFRKIRLYSARLSLATHFKFRFCKTTMPRFIHGEISWENSAPSLKTPVLVS